MLDLLNAAACAVVWAYCFIISVRMPGRGMWGHRAIVWVVTASLGIGMMGPWADWVPRANWSDTALNVCLAVALIVWRREAMAFVRCKFILPPEVDQHPRRRASDWVDT